MKEKILKIPHLLPSRSQRILTPFKFLLNPAKLFNKAVALNTEIFKISMGPEDWIFLSGNEGTRFFGQLTLEDVDAFEFRNRMYTLDLPNAERPLEIAKISRTTNKIINEYMASVSADYITQFFIEKITTYLETHIKNSGTIEDLHSFNIKLTHFLFSSLFYGEEVFSTFPSELGDQYVTVGESLYVLPLIVPQLKPRDKKTRRAKEKIVANFENILRVVKDPNNPIQPAPILQGYLELQKEYGISNENLIWLLNAALWASMHYTSVHGLWIGAELMKNDEFLKNVLAHIPKGSLTVADINNNDYLEGIIMGNIRLHSVFAIPRRVKHNLTFNGYVIPKGSILSISPYIEHHKPENFPHPNVLDPHRWASGASRDHFMPGGLGFFGCIGMGLAINSLKCLWSVLLKNYNLEVLGTIPKLKKSLILLPSKKPISLKYSRK